MPERKRASSVKPREVTLEEALRVIKLNGLKISTDSLEEVERKKEEAPSLLGMKKEVRPYGLQSKKTKSVKVKETNEIELTLYACHGVGGNTYGPGKITLSNPDLAAHLQAADERFINMSLKKTTIREPECFLITGVACPDGSMRNTSLPVGSDFFDSGLDDNSLASVPRSLNGLRVTVAY